MQSPIVDECRRLFEQAAPLARIGAWECDLVTERLSWTDGVYDLFELPRGSRATRDAALDLYEPRWREAMLRQRAEALRTGGGFTLDAQIVSAAGTPRWMRLTAAVAIRNGRPARLFGAKQDVTAEKDLWIRLHHLAERDPLTDLANRRAFDAGCRDLMRREGTGGAAALALIDLDRFKTINDTHGHAAGDACLREVAERLRGLFDASALVARLGGDEFAVLARAEGRGALDEAFARALRALRRPVAWHKTRIPMAASIGVAFLHGCAERTPSALFAQADAALYLAKAAGRSAVRVFGEAVGDAAEASRTERALRACG